MTQPRQSSGRSFSRKELLQRWLVTVATGLLIAAVLNAAFVPSHFPAELLRLHLTVFGLGAMGGILYIFSSQQQRTRIQEWVLASHAELTTEQKLYLRVCFLVACAVLITVTGAGPWMKELLVLILVFFGYVAVRDSLRWYQLLSENVLGKAVLAIGFSVASALAYGLAAQKVAQIIHVTPTNFTRANLLIAIMVIPVLIIMAGAFISAVGIAMSSVIMLPLMLPGFPKIQHWLFAGTWSPSKLRFAFATRLFQVMFYTSVGMGLYVFGRQGLGWYEVLISRQIPSLVYELDMYYGSECKLPAGSKLAPLGDGKFLVANKQPTGEFSFRPPVKCDE